METQFDIATPRTIINNVEQLQPNPEHRLARFLEHILESRRQQLKSLDEIRQNAGILLPSTWGEPSKQRGMAYFGTT